MENEDQKAVDDFLDGLKDNAEGDPMKPNDDDPFASIGKEEKGNQSESGETEAVEEKAEKPIPYHKDPKFQKRIEQEVEKRMAQFAPKQEEKEIQDDYFDGVVNAFTKIVGNDTPEKVEALSALKESLSNLDQRAAQKAIDRLEAARQEEVAQEKEYENRLNDGFETIEEETGIDLYAPENKKIRTRFIDFIEKVAPKENGEISELPDIGETFKVFQSIYKPQTQAPRAKELASKSMERSGGEVSNKPDQGRITWDNVLEKIGL